MISFGHQKKEIHPVYGIVVKTGGQVNGESRERFGFNGKNKEDRENRLCRHLCRIWLTGAWFLHSFRRYGKGFIGFGSCGIVVIGAV